MAGLPIVIPQDSPNNNERQSRVSRKTMTLSMKTPRLKGLFSNQENHGRDNELVHAIQTEFEQGAWHRSLGSRTAYFYYGMFYRTLYYSLFFKIDNWVTVVVFEIINFFVSFTMYFLRMSHFYYVQSDVFKILLMDCKIPFVNIDFRNKDEWRDDLAIRWLIEVFATMICMVDFVISTSVLRWFYTDPEYHPYEELSAFDISEDRYRELMTYAGIIAAFEAVEFVVMMSLFRWKYNLSMKMFLSLIAHSNYYRYIVFFAALHVLQDMYIYKNSLLLSNLFS